MSGDDYRELYYASAFEEALQECDFALSRDSSDPDAIRVKALSLRELGRFQAARECFLTLLRHQPEDLSAQIHVAALDTMLEGQGRSSKPTWLTGEDGRLMMLHSASQFVAEDYNQVGLFLAEKRNQCELALAWYDKALVGHAQPEVVYYNKGCALAQLSRYEEAIGRFKAAIKIRPTYANAYFSMAGTARVAGMYLLALDSFERANELNPADLVAAQRRRELMEELQEQVSRRPVPQAVQSIPEDVRKEILAGLYRRR